MKKLKMSEAITDRDNSSFKKYLAEINLINPLSADEEYEIAVLAANGDEQSLELLVKHNLRFVVSVAKQYVTKELRLEDLVNEGNLGLISASKRFEPSRGFKFISYGVWWIRRSILAYISDHGRIIRLPNNKSNMVQKLKARIAMLEQELEREPSYNELVAYVDGEFTNSQVLFYLDTFTSKVVSMDHTIGDEDETKLSDMIMDVNTVRTDYLLNDADSEYNVNKMLSALKNDKERSVITLLYGLDGDDCHTLKTVSLMLGLTSERVRQIRDASLLRIKKSIK
jgi:RNA polymerase primary sigma factor